MQRRIAVALIVWATLLVGRDACWAADVPVMGTKVVLKRSASGEKLVLLVRDAALAVPAPGDPSDPAQNSGLAVALIARIAPWQQPVLFAPSGFGTPGWSARAHAAGRYVYRNSEAPAGPSSVRRVRFDAKGLKIVARGIGLALAEPQEAVAVIVAMGEARACTVFEGDTVRRDQPGVFIARHAPAPTVTDCLDIDALLAPPCEISETCGGVCPGNGVCGGNPILGCVCASPDQPCGDTAPVCNGECPAGEECANIGGVPSPSCGCLPAGSTGCGTVDPVCGDGDCPDGLTCQLTTFECCGGVSLSACGCGTTDPPDPPCGGTCPDSWQCVIGPGIELCIPFFCSGGSGAPTCGGTCPAPFLCTPLVGQCFCIEPCTGGSPYPTCDGTCTDPTATCRADPEGTGFCACGP
jgi:hypothetical protein